MLVVVRLIAVHKFALPVLRPLPHLNPSYFGVSGAFELVQSHHRAGVS